MILYVIGGAGVLACAVVLACSRAARRHVAAGLAA
jgi:hypothetical protein